MSDYVITEEAMQRFEELIPQRAVEAMRHAYERALTTQGRVLEIRDNKLVEVTAEGKVRVIGQVAPSRPVKPGMIYRLKRKTS